MSGHLYFHSPCFDGIASAVLALDYLEQDVRWQDVTLHPVDYHADWLQRPLATPAAVVDFLYHPDAEFWADHHATTFRTEAAKTDYLRRKGATRIFCPDTTSCAKLLDSRLRPTAPRYDREELVSWADKIDSANYESCHEALHGDAPALRINTSLEFSKSKRYTSYLVRVLRHSDLSSVSQGKHVSRVYRKARAQIDFALKWVRTSTRLTAHGIAVFNGYEQEFMVPRYAPYERFPDAQFSVGITRNRSGIQLTTMRNPWDQDAARQGNAPTVHLGNICERVAQAFGIPGGGHQRVAGVVLSNVTARVASDVLEQVVGRIAAVADSDTQ